jgi:integrase/recombinase XerD
VKHRIYVLHGTLGKRLTSILSEEGISQREAAAIAGVSKSTMSAWTTGASPSNLAAASVEEVKELLVNAKNFSPNYLYPFLYTVAHTGARKNEVLKLHREEIDFNTGLLHLRKTKNGEDRSIRMPLNLVGHLKAHLESHESQFAFPNPDGNAVGRSQLERLMKRFSKHFPTEKKLGLHSLRHSFAYNYLKKGGEMYQLQAILGHKHIQVTVDLYGQLKAQDIENVSPYEE